MKLECRKRYMTRDGKRKISKLSKEDHDLMSLNWRVRYTASSGPYLVRELPKKKQEYLHRAVAKRAFGFIPNSVDHINGNTLDNRRENLRLINHSQNAMNSRKQKNRSSQYKGVCLHKQWGWCANICIKSNKIHIGWYRSEEDAAQAYDLCAIQAFSGFARLNFKWGNIESIGNMRVLEEVEI
jgi:hypothetical protein